MGSGCQLTLQGSSPRRLPRGEGTPLGEERQPSTSDPPQESHPCWLLHKAAAPPAVHPAVCVGTTADFPTNSGKTEVSPERGQLCTEETDFDDSGPLIFVKGHLTLVGGGKTKYSLSLIIQVILLI